MALIKFQNGQTVRFNGDPTPQDIEEVATKLGLQKAPAQQETQTPQEQKPFTFDVAQPKVDLKTKILNANKQAEKYKQKAQKASSPLGFASNVGRGVFDFLAAPEIGLGKTIAKTQGNQAGAYSDQIVNLNNTNAQLYKTIKNWEKQGKDTTKLKMSYNANVKQLASLGGGLNEEMKLPTEGEAIGQIGGTALDVLTAGTYGKAKAGMSSFKLAAAPQTSNALTKVLGKNVSGAVSTILPETSKILPTKSAGLFTKQGAKNVLRGAGVGYASDVSMNLQGFGGEEKMGQGAWQPGIGTAIGAIIPGALAGEQSYKYRKSPGFQSNIRVNALNKLNKDYANLRKLAPDKQTVKMLADTDVLVGKIDKDGVIRTMDQGGAWDDFHKLTINGIEDVVTRAVEREGNEIPIEAVEKHLRKTLNESNLAGSEKKAGLSAISNELEGLALDINPKTGKLPVIYIQKSKIGKGTKTNYLDPVADIVKKTVTRGLKELVENNTKSINVTATNKELGKYYKTLKYIEKLDGKRVKGGKLGKYFARGFGMVVGGAFGPAESIVGGEVASRLLSKKMTSQFGKETGSLPVLPKVLRDASDISQSPKRVSAINSNAKNVTTSPIINSNKAINDITIPRKKPVVKTRLPINKVNVKGLANDPGSSVGQVGTKTYEASSSKLPTYKSETTAKTKLLGKANSLIQEAKKYKTAEEFAQSKPNRTVKEIKPIIRKK